MPAKPKVEEEVVAALIRAGKSPSDICRELGMTYGSGVRTRFERISRKIGVPIFKHKVVHDSAEVMDTERRIEEYMREGNARRHLNLDNGVVLVGSDAHYWPDIITTAHRAFCLFARELRPAAVVLNGDGFDGASISRFPRIGWDSRPTVAQELQAVEDRLGEIEDAARTRNLYWPLGNHDARFETYLAAHAPEYEGVEGFHLKDRFPRWSPCWSVWVNDDTVIKHRMRGGIHATRNNTLNAGRTVVTGHLHSLKVSPIRDYNGVRWGVDTGTLAEPEGPQFQDYTEDNPVDWRSGFIVLTYWRGRLLWPEVAHVIGQGQVEWRGGVVEVPNV